MRPLWRLANIGTAEYREVPATDAHTNVLVYRRRQVARHSSPATEPKLNASVSALHNA